MVQQNQHNQKRRESWSSLTCNSSNSMIKSKLKMSRKSHQYHQAFPRTRSVISRILFQFGIKWSESNWSYVKSINSSTTLKSHHSNEQAAAHASKISQQQRSRWLRETSSSVRSKQRTGNCYHLVSEKTVHGSQLQQLLLDFHGVCPGHGEIKLTLINKILWLKQKKKNDFIF